MSNSRVLQTSTKLKHAKSNLLCMCSTAGLFSFYSSFSFPLGIHAREWISPATATFIMRELVENQAENQDLIDFFDFYILPVANPDG